MWLVITGGYELTKGTGNTGWTNVWRYGDKTNYHMTNLGGTFRTLDNVDGRCELDHGILSQVSAPLMGE